MNKFKELYYWLFIAKGSGLKKDKKDHRDLKLKELGFTFFNYKPKNTKKIIRTLSVKDQKNLNTCTFNAATVQKEIDEGVVLSVRSLVAYAKSAGLLSGNGWSTLRNAQKALQQYGILEGKDCPDINSNNWNEYVNINFNKEKAAKHKIKTYWKVESRNEILKLIDEGKIVTAGMDWYTKFNQSNGFCFPWIISKVIGYLVGGHSVALKGYWYGYEGKNVYVFQNSYSNGWGAFGDFYVDMDYFDKYCMNKFGCFANLDIPLDVGLWLKENQGKVVKKEDDPKVYLIVGDKKRWYPDAAILFVNGRTFADIEIVDAEILDKVKSGDDVKFEEGRNIKEYKNAIKYDDKLKELFKNYI